MAVGENEDACIFFDGCWNPTQANVGVSPDTVHHDVRYFSKRFLCQPERGLAGKGMSDRPGSTLGTLGRALRAGLPAVGDHGAASDRCQSPVAR